MYRRCSSVLVSVILIVATSTVSAMAQSGRGRQLRIQQTLRGELVAPPVAEIQPAQKSDPGPLAIATGAMRKNSSLIYNDASANQKKDSGEYHQTKADKRAGWILLGLLVLGSVVMIANDGDF